MLTTKGEIEETALQRTVGVEDRPDMLVLWMRYLLDAELVRADAFRFPKECGPIVGTIRGPLPIESLSRTIELTETPTDFAVAVVWRYGMDLVRRDAHVVTKQASVVSGAAVSAVG